MGILFSCCRKSKSDDYKKVEPRSVDDIEAGGGGDDDEEWDEFPEVTAPAEPEEPEPEPEPDPFAEMGMAPTIKPTKRHVAQSVWAQPAAPTNSRFAMTPDDASTDAWGDDDLADLGVNEKRRAAEQRREQRRRQREEGGSGAPREKPRGLAATRVAE